MYIANKPILSNGRMYKVGEVVYLPSEELKQRITAGDVTEIIKRKTEPVKVEKAVEKAESKPKTGKKDKKNDI